IPYLTLLDLDVARHQAGWGRIKYVNDQLGKYRLDQQLPKDYGIPKWDSTENMVRDFDNYLEALEDRDVYFSYPMDLDFAMLLAYPDAYGVVREKPDESTIKAVLGKSHHDASQYSEDEQKLFGTYHRSFKLGSKPAAHIDALAKLSDEGLLANMPESLGRLADAVIAKLAELPE
ncbi:ATP-dependent endonuclease, partial [Pseudomonas aeruginosa]|nr:ATP-dependent endonuclease [Pseudomonas aeruginosa]